MTIQLIVGMVMLLLFFYLKNKPRKEGEGFLTYMGTLIVLAVLLVGGISMLFTSGFGVAPSAGKAQKASSPAPAATKAPEPQATRQNVPPADVKVSPWRVITGTDPIDDSKTVRIVNDALRPIDAQVIGTVTPRLVLECMRNRTKAYIIWGRFNTTSDHTVTARIDKRPAMHLACDASTDFKASFIRKPIRFIRSLIGHDNMVVEVTPYGENPQTTEFDISGLGDEISPLREACHW